MTRENAFKLIKELFPKAEYEGGAAFLYPPNMIPNPRIDVFDVLDALRKDAEPEISESEVNDFLDSLPHKYS